MKVLENINKLLIPREQRQGIADRPEKKEHLPPIE
jgi:hypothetical protein